MKTKNLILMLLTIVTLNSCDEDYDSKPTIYSNGETSDLKIYVIDSCEYIGKLRGLKSDVITHKGNCKFCKMRLENQK